MKFILLPCPLPPAVPAVRPGKSSGVTAELTAALMMEVFLQTSPLTKAETPIIRGSVPPLF